MKVNVISRKLIKPLTPTPQNLKKYKISFTDELSPPMNINVILFYPSNNTPKPFLNLLEQSLAKILPQFYPLARRYIKNDPFVDCCDEGAELVEAEATDIDLIAKMKNKQHLNDLLSRKSHELDRATDPLLSIQITTFKCDGLAIGVSMSHRIGDASSLGTFIEAWSNANYHLAHTSIKTIIIRPSFDSPLLFPGKNLGNNSTELPRTRDPNIVVKRLLFNKEDIANLKSKFVWPNDNRERFYLSRVRVVSALIANALICLDRAKYGKSRGCIVVQPVNIRERLNPPLPKHSFGNLAIPSVAIANDTKEMGFQELVYLLKDAVDKTIIDMSHVLSSGEDGHNIILSCMNKTRELLKSGEVNALLFTDRSKFRFYEKDFGWGRPFWVGVGTMARRNATMLMENGEGDGIEAWVHLDRDDVPHFERYLKLPEMGLE